MGPVGHLSSWAVLGQSRVVLGVLVTSWAALPARSFYFLVVSEENFVLEKNPTRLGLADFCGFSIFLRADKQQSTISMNQHILCETSHKLPIVPARASMFGTFQGLQAMRWGQLLYVYRVCLVLRGL